jgi:hypothetical protein
VTAAKLKAAAGLAYLDNRRYKLAARAFVEVSPELSTSYSDVSTYVASGYSAQSIRSFWLSGRCDQLSLAIWPSSTAVCGYLRRFD